MKIGKNQIRSTGVVLAILAVTATAYMLGQRNPVVRSAPQSYKRVLYYMDPMHPSYHSDKPGIAPDCGMQLEPVMDGAGASSDASFPGAVSINDATQRLLGMRLASVEKSGGSHAIRVVGRVTPEDTRLYTINSGVEGFIRETYNDSAGEFVKQDQKLATYYAPDFLAASSGFLAANERVPGSVTKEGTKSIQNYSDRLRNLGMSDLQIKRMAETRQLPESIDVVAPAAGFILARNVSPRQHFAHGAEFYRIADLSQVWVAAEVDDKEVSHLRTGAIANITIRGDSHRMTGRISPSLPQSEEGGGTAKVRIEVDNPGYLLRPGMLVDVDLPVNMAPAMTVPVDSLVDSGTSSRVYVARDNGVFEPRQVETGWRSGDRVEILHGLKQRERVVASATFLVDSESRLAAPDHAVQTVKDPSCGMPVNRASSTASGLSLAYSGADYFFCSIECKEKFKRLHGGGD